MNKLIELNYAAQAAYPYGWISTHPRVKPTPQEMAQQVLHAKCMAVAATLIGDLWT